MTSLDLGWKNGGLGKALSNLFPYPFVLDGIRCGSIEGFLQSLKQSEIESQNLIAALHGYNAYKVGQLGNDWKETQTLYWCGEAFPRTSRAYHDLISRAYDACFDQNPEFQDALFQSGVDIFTHHMGKHDPSDTTLTMWEYLFSMYRLRARAQQKVLVNDLTPNAI